MTFFATLRHINKVIQFHECMVVNLPGNALWVYKFEIPALPFASYEACLKERELHFNLYKIHNEIYDCIIIELPEQFHMDTLLIEHTVLDGIVTLSAFKTDTFDHHVQDLLPGVWNIIPIEKVPVPLQRLGNSLKNGSLALPLLVSQNSPSEAFDL